MNNPGKIFYAVFLLSFLPLMVEAQQKTVPGDTSYTAIGTYLKIKKQYPNAVLLPDSLPSGVIGFRNVTYSVIPDSPYGRRELKMDIFRKNDHKKYPVLIMVHGGAWNSGNKTMEVPMAQRIAAHGYVTIAVEYRLLPEATYPAALCDLKTAVRWVRANARKYGMDAGKIAISGTSAGGHLAALVGMTNGSAKHEDKREYKRFSGDVQAVIDMDGVVTFVNPENIAETNSNITKLGGKLPINAQWLGGRYEDATANWNEASPLLHVSAKSAPICFINCQNPRYGQGREELMQKLAGFGIYSEKHRIEVMMHPFWLFRPWVDEVIDYSVHFLDKTLKGK